MLTPDFGTMQNAIEIASSDKVFYMRNFTLPGRKILPGEELAGGRACRAKTLPGLKSLPGKSLLGWKLSRPIRPKAEDGLK